MIKKNSYVLFYIIVFTYNISLFCMNNQNNNHYLNVLERAVKENNINIIRTCLKKQEIKEKIYNTDTDGQFLKLSLTNFVKACQSKDIHSIAKTFTIFKLIAKNTMLPLCIATEYAATTNYLYSCIYLKHLIMECKKNKQTKVIEIAKQKYFQNQNIIIQHNIHYFNGLFLFSEHLLQHFFAQVDFNIQLLTRLTNAGLKLDLLVDNKKETIFHKFAHHASINIKHYETDIHTQSDFVTFFSNSYKPRIGIQKNGSIVKLLTTLDDINEKSSLTDVLSIKNTEGKTALDILLDNAKCYVTTDNVLFLNKAVIEYIVAYKKNILLEFFEKFNPEYWKNLKK